ESCLVVWSGLDGVEGFFGSAVQLNLMRRWMDVALRGVRVVFLHSLNPYGFAWVRRFDDENVDPNRNFLREGEVYAGGPEGYGKLDPFLNPKRPPSRFELFRVKALAAIARFGLRALKQTVATGQYQFPQGIFFGGSKPSRTKRILEERLGAWLGSASRVIHFDFHTGLGRWGTCKLLVDHALTDTQRARLTACFGAGAFEE